MKIYEVFKKIQETSGTNDKKQILKENINEVIKYIFTDTYGAAKYYIKSFEPLKRYGYSTLENDYEQFTTKLIINQNELKDVWNRNRDTLESYSPDGSLNVGDELQYTRNKRTYRFKIILKQGYSEDADVLFVYTLSSIIETINEDRDE